MNQSPSPPKLLGLTTATMCHILLVTCAGKTSGRFTMTDWDAAERGERSLASLEIRILGHGGKGPTTLLTITVQHADWASIPGPCLQGDKQLAIADPLVSIKWGYREQVFCTLAQQAPGEVPAHFSPPRRGLETLQIQYESSVYGVVCVYVRVSNHSSRAFGFVYYYYLLGNDYPSVSLPTYSGNEIRKLVGSLVISLRTKGWSGLLKSVPWARGGGCTVERALT